MIRYALKCQEGHVFDSWFQSASAFDVLAKAGHLSCTVCGITSVEKTLMSPRVAPKQNAQDTQPLIGAEATQQGGNLPAVPNSKQVVTEEQKAEAIAEMRRNIEENATYVGGDFAQKARDMHDGTAPEASIYGEASGAEAVKLIEEGVPVIPLPFKPKQKMQ